MTTEDKIIEELGGIFKKLIVSDAAMGFREVTPEVARFIKSYLATQRSEIRKALWGAWKNNTNREYYLDDILNLPELRE